MSQHDIEQDKMMLPGVHARPKHVAIIMDGNGRWAKQRHQERIEGHRQGVGAVRAITTFARELKIAHLTLFSFSAQNWQRPAAEVNALMGLLEQYCIEELDTMMRNGVRLSMIGCVTELPSRTRNALEKVMRQTESNTEMVLTLAVDYGAREELLLAVKRIGTAVASGALAVDDINMQTFEGSLLTAGMPDPDLVIRTSGEVRLSNFLLWQCAYAELYFTDVLWPDFTKADFAHALQIYAQRNRRYGATTNLDSDTECSYLVH